MQIQVDTREHKAEWERIQKQFDDMGIKYFRSKMYVGDYQSLDNPRLVIDRKKNLQELCGNVCQQHERFKAELIRALQQNIKIVILVEHGEDVKTLEDVWFWENPRKHEIRWRMVNGKRVRTVQSEKAVDGPQLYRSLKTIKDRYNVDFVFCTKEQTGQKIVEILNNDS
ncbi:MAG: ERCC4 domain-containing protein [Roseburia hominis]